MSPAAELIWLDPGVWRTISSKARGLVGSYGFTSADCEDLQQEAALDLHLRFRLYDPARSGRRTFVQRVVSNRFANLIAERQAMCRDYTLCQQSLDEPLAPGGVEQLGDVVSADEYETRMRRTPLSGRDYWELHTDVERAIALLPSDLAVIARLLETEPVSQIARRLGLARCTVYRRVERLRTAFVQAGLDRYIFTYSCRSTEVSR